MIIRSCILILLKTLRSSFEGLRTNGGEVEIFGDFPFMLSLVDAFIGFFSRIVFCYLLAVVLLALNHGSSSQSGI